MEIIRTQLRLPKGIYKTVRDFAKAKDLSMNQALIEIIQNGIRKAPPPAKLSEALELITNAILENQHDKL